MSNDFPEYESLMNKINEANREIRLAKVRLEVQIEEHEAQVKELKYLKNSKRLLTFNKIFSTLVLPVMILLALGALWIYN